MESFLLAAHVLVGILFVGPIAVTTSLFPRFAPQTAALRVDASVAPASVSRRSTPHRPVSRPPVSRLPDEAPSDGRPDVAGLLHRITRTYGILALAVPAVGLILAGVQGRLGEVWITAAMVLTALAGGILALRIVPAQRDALRQPMTPSQQRNMRLLVGVFNLLWAAVVVLMIMRPGAE